MDISELIKDSALFGGNVPNNRFKEAEEYLKKAKQLMDAQKPIKMKFKDAPIGARFNFIGDDKPKETYIKIHEFGDGLVAQWDGNVKGHQSLCCWLDKENGYDFDSLISVI